MNFKVALNLPKLVRFKVGVKLGFEDGAKLDLRVKLRGGKVWRWSAMAEPAKHKKLDEPKHKRLENGHEEEAPLISVQPDHDRIGH